MATAALNPIPAHKPQETFDSVQASTKPSPQTIPISQISIPRGSVTATLNFYAPPADGSPPHNWVNEPTDGTPQRNFGHTSEQVSISDIRSRAERPTLDANAFELLTTSESAEKSFTDDASIEANYYPEVKKLLLDNLPGSHKIFIFDHTVRRPGADAKRGPVTRVHIDQTRKSARARVSYHLPAEAETLLAGRVRLVNVWRPLNGPIVAFPLAVCDGSSVDEEDLVAVEHRYPDRTGETAGVSYAKGQKWYYASGMKNEERLLLKCFDSDEKHGGVGRVPHSAFEDPRTEEGWPGRASIEVRALVFG